MITYELALKLKKAGYKGLSEAPVKIGIENGIERYDRLTILPSLSSLIEACGDNFKGLEKDYLNDGVWLAASMTNWDGALEDTDFPSGKGSTPEEAVSNLWLALNKK